MSVVKTKYSQPWMKRWTELAASSQSLGEVNDQAGIKMAQYYRGRLEDPAFDRVALMFD